MDYAKLEGLHLCVYHSGNQCRVLCANWSLYVHVFTMVESFWSLMSTLPPLTPCYTSSPVRCCVCQTTLPESYYAMDDGPYCMDHYYETTAHRCQACGTYITGPTMVSQCTRIRYWLAVLCVVRFIQCYSGHPYFTLNVWRGSVDDSLRSCLHGTLRLCV